jgi:hypothetical protein
MATNLGIYRITILSGSPYNNRFNPTQRGRHAFCLGGSQGWVVRQKSRRNPLSSVLSRPAERGPQLRGLIERYTDGTKSVRHKGGI